MIQLVRPCLGRITQWFANIQSHDGRKHTGNDYGYYLDGKITDAVFAAADGVVLFAGDSRTLGWPNDFYINPDFDRTDAQDSSAGNFIAIAHAQNGIRFVTTYSHLAAWTVKAGQAVTASQRIATIGDTGFSAGKHLHFELLFRPFNFGTSTYGRSDPNPYISTGIAAMGSAITPQSQEDELSAKEVQEIKDFVYSTLGTMLTQYHDVTRSNVIGELSKKIEDNGYQVKVFVQAVDNENTDRSIHDARAQEAETRAALEGK